MNSELEDLRRESQQEWKKVGTYKRCSIEVAEAELARQGGLRDMKVDPRKIMEKLTRKEKSILHLIVEGFSKHEICDLLSMKPHTYDVHVSNMNGKAIS